MSFHEYRSAFVRTCATQGARRVVVETDVEPSELLASFRHTLPWVA